jgi:hypothetical protein
MTRPLLAAMALALMSSLAVAQTETTPDSSDLSTKAAKDAPATKQDGMTADPTAKPKTGDLTDKAMKDAPGTTGGMTSDPTGEPMTGDIPSNAKKPNE